MNIIALAKTAKVFMKVNQYSYQETSAVTSDFNRPREDYINYISTDLSFQMMNTQNSGR